MPKLSHAEVEYEHPAQGPNHCSQCKHYRGPNDCEIVSNPIRPEDWCKRFMGNWIQKAVKHPGALTRAAKARGLSKKQEAEREAHSSNPHVRARGILGKRFMSGDLSK